MTRFTVSIWRRPRALCTSAALVLAIGLRTAGAIDVTACEQTVPVGEIGDLVGDLACGTNGINLARRATLRLNGFTITGTSSASAQCVGSDTCAGVECQDRSCRVEGPGQISGFLFGVHAQGPSDRTFHAKLSDLVLTGNQAGFWGDDVRVDDAQVTSNVLVGILGGKRARVQDSQVLNNVSGGISGTQLRIYSTTVSGVGPGALSAIQGDRVRLRDVVVGNCQSGGVSATRSLSAVDSTLTDNTPDDVRAFGHAPHLVNTTCFISSDGVGGTWGVCEHD